MTLSECLILWDPNTPAVPASRRGAFAVVPDTPFSRAEACKFRYLSGATDPRASDARLDVRLAFAAELAHTLVVRDRLPAPVVHGALLHVAEYAAAFQSQIDCERSQPR